MIGIVIEVCHRFQKPQDEELSPMVLVKILFWFEDI